MKQQQARMPVRSAKVELKGPKRAASTRARHYIAGLVAGKSKRQAAKAAGYSDTVASHPGRKLDNQPAVQALFVELLEQAGVSDELLAQRIYEGLNATRVSRETMHAKREVRPDFEERRKMVQFVVTLKGYVQAGELQQNTRPIQISWLGFDIDTSEPTVSTKPTSGPD